MRTSVPVEPRRAHALTVATVAIEATEATEATAIAAPARHVAVAPVAVKPVVAKPDVVEPVVAKPVVVKPVEVAPARASRDAAKARAARERAQAKEAKRQERRAKAALKAGADDHIVEPPREPKLPFAQRLRASRRAKDGGTAAQTTAKETAKETTKKTTQRTAGGRRVLGAVVGALGAIGLVCSIVLAVGALLVALGTDSGSFFDAVSSTCDVLVGPLRDVFSFSGTNADMKESLVAWGAGSIIYLLVGLVAQSVLRSAIDD